MKMRKTKLWSLKSGHWSFPNLRNITSMRILLSVFQFPLQLVAQRLVDKVFDAVGRRVDVIGRQPELFDEVRFPQAVAAHKAGGAPAAVVRHVQLAVANLHAAAVP